MIKVYVSLSDGYRDVLALLLNHLEDIKIVGTSGDIARLIPDVAKLNPDVILMGLAQPLELVLETIEKMKISFPEKKILIFSNDRDRQTIVQVVEAGADGYVLMSTPLLKLFGHIKDVYEGGAPMSAPVARSIFNALSSVNKIFSLPEGEFTTREMHTLRLLVKGLTYKEISNQLEISLDTVRSHIKNIYSKLHVNSKSEAIIKVLTGK